jgi:hypothetical protein
MKAINALLALGLVAFVGSSFGRHDSSDDLMTLGNKLSIIREKLENAKMELHNGLRQVSIDEQRHLGNSTFALPETSMTHRELDELLQNAKNYINEVEKIMHSK